jgi:hypothetical protein
VSLQQYVQKFVQLTKNQSVDLRQLLDTREVGIADLGGERDGRVDELARQAGPFSGFLGDFLMALKSSAQHDEARAFEFMSEALKKWSGLYEKDEDDVKKWMVAPFVRVSTSARDIAVKLDGNSDKYQKKLVEVMRQIFQKLHKEKAKKPVCVWTCCELLRMYFKLGQVNQCPFIISALTQPYREGFTLTDLPRPIAVAMNFYWGKHLVFDHKFKDAEEKLTWAFNELGDSVNNRRLVLEYLIPCNILLGNLPSPAMLEQYRLYRFRDIVRAIRVGDVRLFTSELEKHAEAFIQVGTYLLVEKSKLLVYRTLCRRVHGILKEQTGGKHQLDLAAFEKVFAWQEDMDADEVACVLSNLIFQGAMKAYISNEHRKIVFSKDKPFPPIAAMKYA